MYVHYTHSLTYPEHRWSMDKKMKICSLPQKKTLTVKLSKTQPKSTHSRHITNTLSTYSFVKLVKLIVSLLLLYSFFINSRAQSNINVKVRESIVVSAWYKHWRCVKTQNIHQHFEHRYTSVVIRLPGIVDKYFHMS